MRLGTTRTPIKKGGRHSSWAADGLRSRTYTPARESGVGMKRGSFVFGLIVGFCALAQQASPVLLGSWTATAGPNQIFRGTCPRRFHFIIPIAQPGHGHFSTRLVT